MNSKHPLEISNISHQYDNGPEVLRNVSLSVARGELVAVLGASGSGKSTLLRSVAGFVTPTHGSISIGGRLVTEGGKDLVPPEQRGVGMVFQDYALFPHMTVSENIAFGIHEEANRQSRVHELLDLVGLVGMESRRPSTLSGGQQQRVALARALAPNPELLVLDEPFANLDGSLRLEISNELQRILKEKNVSALLVTHERNEALGLASRVLVLDGSREGSGAVVAQFGSPREVYGQPSTEGVASLTGPYNLVLGEGEGEVAHTVLGTVKLHQPVKGSCKLILRPETLSVSLGGPHRVVRVRFAGAAYHLDVKTDTGNLMVHHEGEPPEVGENVTIRVVGYGAALHISQS